MDIFFISKTPIATVKNNSFFFQSPKSSPKKAQVSHHESIFKPQYLEKPKLTIPTIVSPKNKFSFEQKELILKEEKKDIKENNFYVNKKDIYLLQKNIRFMKETNGELNTLAMRDTQSNRLMFFREFNNKSFFIIVQ